MAQRKAAAKHGVARGRVYVDKGLSSLNGARPGLDQAVPRCAGALAA